MELKLREAACVSHDEVAVTMAFIMPRNPPSDRDYKRIWEFLGKPEKIKCCGEYNKRYQVLHDWRIQIVRQLV